MDKFGDGACHHIFILLLFFLQSMVTKGNNLFQLGAFRIDFEITKCASC